MVGYWKGLYQKAEAREEGLRNKASHFERQAERLIAEQPPSSSQAVDGKRKRASGVAAGRTAKRGKVKEFATWDESSLEKLDGSRITGKRMFLLLYKCSAIPNVEPAGRTLLRHIFDLHQLLRQDSPDSTEIAWMIQRACSATRTTISTVISSCFFPAPVKSTAATAGVAISKEDIDVAFVAMSRIVHLLIMAYERMAAGHDTTTRTTIQSRAAVNHALASLFRETLTDLASCIEHITLTDRASSSTAAVAPKSRPRRSKTSTATPAGINAANPAHDLPTYIARLLHTFLQSTLPKTPQHEDLHQGLTGLLLTRAGALLYTLTFSTGSRASTISAEIAASSIYRPSTTAASGITITTTGSDAPKSIAAGLESNANPEAAKRVAVAEAKYILPLVERVLLSTNRETLPSTRDSNSTLVYPLLLKMQNTLIRGVFGEDDGGAFADVLRMPREVELQTPAGHLDGKDDADQDAAWFLARMWEVCGWDVLSRKLQEEDCARDESMPDLP